MYYKMSILSCNSRRTCSLRCFAAARSCSLNKRQGHQLRCIYMPAIDRSCVFLPSLNCGYLRHRFIHLHFVLGGLSLLCFRTVQHSITNSIKNSTKTAEKQHKNAPASNRSTSAALASSLSRFICETFRRSCFPRRAAAILVAAAVCCTCNHSRDPSIAGMYIQSRQHQTRTTSAALCASATASSAAIRATSASSAMRFICSPNSRATRSASACSVLI